MTDGTASAVDSDMLQEVTIVIVTFNSAHCLPELGRLLASCPYIMLVDNGSDDDSARVATQHLPSAKVIALPNNLGFGAANNRALAQVCTPFALLLNPDCEITPHAIAKLLHTAHQWPHAAMVAPQLLQINGASDVNYRWPNLWWQSRGPGVTDGPACVALFAAQQCSFALVLLAASSLTSDFSSTTKTMTCAPAYSGNIKPCSSTPRPRPRTVHADACAGTNPCEANTSGATTMPNPN
jgi:hypothetical protein